MSKHPMYFTGEGRGKWRVHITSISYRENDYDNYEIASLKKADFNIRTDPILDTKSLIVELEDPTYKVDGEHVTVLRTKVAVTNLLYLESDQVGLVGFLYLVEQRDVEEMKESRSGWMALEEQPFEVLPVRVSLSRK